MSNQQQPRRTDEPMWLALRKLMLEHEMIEDKELAEKSGVTQATVSRYLSRNRGKMVNRQAMETIHRLAEALRVEPEFFIEYRTYKAEKLVRDAVRSGRITLEDVEMLLKGGKAVEDARSMKRALGQEPLPGDVPREGRHVEANNEG